MNEVNRVLVLSQGSDTFKNIVFSVNIRKVPHGLRDWGASNCDSESRKVFQTKIQTETNTYIETIKSFGSRAFV